MVRILPLDGLCPSPDGRVALQGACKGWPQLSPTSAIASRLSRRSVFTASLACYRSAGAMVPTALANALVALCEAPMTGPSETLPVLESRLAERLLAFEFLDEAWPRGRTAIGGAIHSRAPDRSGPATQSLRYFPGPSPWGHPCRSGRQG